MFETWGLVNLGIFSGEDLDISSWWSRLAAKLTVSVKMDSVADIDTYAKREMRSKILGMPFPLFYISCIILLRLSPNMRIFVYSGIT